MCPTIACEEAKVLRRRCRSADVRGRYGVLCDVEPVDSEECGFRLVEKHTFLEVEFDSEPHTGCELVCKEDKFDWETASNVTTETPSTDARCSSEGSESDAEGESFGLPSMCPPGHFEAQQFQPLAIVGVLQPAIFCMQSFEVAAPEVPKRKKRVTVSAWGAEKKKKMSKGKESFTTIMIKNLPGKCTNVMMMEMLDSVGLQGQYNFIYAPTDFRNYTSFGYAFVNLVSHDVALQAMEALEDWVCPTWGEQATAFEVCWSEPHQGLHTHVKRYQNSPVMHPDVLAEYKPLLLKNGVVQRFPAPTKRIREPRLRRSCPQSDTL
jgi:hypothetical protein